VGLPANYGGCVCVFSDPAAFSPTFSTWFVMTGLSCIACACERAVLMPTLPSIQGGSAR